MSELKIFKASAGSGKTFQLAGEYLRLVFTNPADYSRILAVTFTHKATAEMKGRILDQLHRLATGQKSPYLDLLIDQTKLNAERIKERAVNLLQRILHDYSRFYVGTIDSFFQTVLRSFTREIGLQGGYEVELDNQKVIKIAVSKLISDAGENEILREWLLEFADEKMKAGKSWNFSSDLEKTGQELYKEDFLNINKDVKNRIMDKKFLNTYIHNLVKIEKSFETFFKKTGNEGLEIMNRFDLTSDDFKGKKGGIGGYFNKLSSGADPDPKITVRNAKDNLDSWSTKDSKRIADIEKAFYEGLNSLLCNAIEKYDKSHTEYFTAKEIRKQLYSFGILNDLSQKLREYTKEKGIFLLSDTPALLSDIINNNDSPFIYEKTGSFFKHYMIDEFQDTSGLQWNNFKPLISDSIANNNFSMLVGDVKQSIYRWRNGDWSLLAEKVEKDFNNRVKKKNLEYNRRSLGNLIDFNNSFFANATSLLQERFNTKLSEENGEQKDNNELEKRILNAYKDSYQYLPDKKQGGYIRINFLNPEDWKDKVLELLPSQLEDLQDKGYSLRDIAILVRSNRDGVKVAESLLEWKKKAGSDSKYKYDIISNEALTIDYSSAVQLILQVMAYLSKPTDLIAIVSIIIEYNMRIMPGIIPPEKIYNSFAEIYLNKYKDRKLNNGDPVNYLELFKNFLPEDFYNKHKWLRNLPLYEMVEQIISAFNLNKNKENIPYLQSFQDCVLNFTRKRTSDIKSFIDWWKEEGYKLSIKIPDNQNAVRIMTIHKAKGLGVKAVLLPFCDWPMESVGNKSDILWCRPSEAPFNEIAILPVKYSANLSKTIFKTDYYNEKLQSWIDNLNLMYVAFTRSENELIINTPLIESKKDEIKSTGDLLNNIFLGNSPSVPNDIFGKGKTIDLHKNMDKEKAVYEFGDNNIIYVDNSIENDMNKPDIPLDEYPVVSTTNRLRLRLGCDSYFRIDEKNMSKEITIGKLKHELFEHIIIKEDVNGAIKKLVFEGKLNNDEGRKLGNQINEAMKNPLISSWFDPKWKVKTESSILVPGGTEYRPDRVLINKKHLVIVDYKFTIKQAESHKKQVKNYMKYMLDMGFEKVEGYLWYVDQNKVEELIL
ncbi:UvrD-helicase domain-containing protein [Bacteroidota bacterium]